MNEPTPGRAFRMTDTRESTPSVVERTRSISTGAGVVGIHFFKNTAAFVLSEDAVLLAPLGGEPQRIDVHGGAILATAADDGRIITGGDDGKVVALTADGNTETLATDPKRRWIDRVALGPDRAVAWSAGKQAFVRSGKDTERMLELPSTVGALAFAPKGFRLAIAHYNGATLWFPNAKAEPERLEWKGSHLGATVSPDGRFLVTAMQEAATARLAARRPQGHAHAGLQRARPVARLDRRRQMARDLGLAAAHPLAVPGQGRPDGQDAEDAGAGRRGSLRRRLPPQGRRSPRSAMPTASC